MKGMLVACIAIADGCEGDRGAIDAVREMTALCFPLLVTGATQLHQTPEYLRVSELVHVLRIH